MRDWMFRNGFADLSDKSIERSDFTIGELSRIFNRTVTRSSAVEYYYDKVDTIAGCLATYIYGWGQCKEKHFNYPSIANPDWMWEYFEMNNTFIGHCPDDSFAEGMILRSINIPSVIGGMKHHAVPLYYNHK